MISQNFVTRMRTTIPTGIKLLVWFMINIVGMGSVLISLTTISLLVHGTIPWNGYVAIMTFGFGGFGGTLELLCWTKWRPHGL